jgi:hypothetical protein
MRACVCDRIAVGICWYCQHPRSLEERRAFIRAGIPRKGEKVVTPWSKEEAFEQERKRLNTKKKRKA